MNISQKGIDMIKSFEGLRLHAYKAVPTERYYTIGYGHYGADVKEGSTISKEQAEILLKEDLKKYVYAVNQYVEGRVNQNQFDALVSFTYNVGVGGLKLSTLLRNINNGSMKEASIQFDKWIHSGGKRLEGLVKRRAKEKALFLTPVKKPTKNHVVKSGDMLEKLAKKYHTTVAELMSLNPKIKDEDEIFIGQVIKVPNK